jgi:hypothetical protein
VIRNQAVTRWLDEIADRREAGAESPFRVGACRNAAQGA